ncbi:alpha/beta-hydrolase [Phlegmacium glaucopus]|nr:alpha/beta-hydrolase [Phlegmacium glaucopus]
MTIAVETINYESQLQFDLYTPPNSRQNPLICFIHGGAWRSEDKQDHAQLARNLALATSYPVAVPNYRLSPTTGDPVFVHPAHTQDLLQFLNFILSHPSPTFDPHNLILIGHSCSAHMLACIFLDSSAISPSLSPSSELLNSVKGIVMSEGIYDIDTLLTSFPSYREWFIQRAFGIAESYGQFSVLKYPSRPSSPAISWLLLHSKGDTLVDPIQTNSMYDHLSQLPPHKVSRNVDDLVEEHDNCLRSDRYVELVNQFTSQIFK